MNNGILILLFVCCFNSCADQKSKTEKQYPQKLTFKPPVIKTAGNPIVVALDSMEKPFRFLLPDKDSFIYTIKTKQGIRRQVIRAPERMPASFFINMPNFNTDQGLGVTQVYSCLQDRNGCLWFGTAGGGVTRYDGKSAVSFTSNQGLGNNTVISIAEDHNGNIWLALDGGGIAKYDGRLVTNYTFKDGLISNEVRAVAIDRLNRVWLGTRYGVSCFDGKRFNNYTTKDGLVNDEVQCCESDKSGNIWIGTIAGASYFNGESFFNLTEKDGLAGSSVVCITEDGKRNVWFGFRRGNVTKYDGRSFTNFNDPPLGQQSIHRILEDHLGYIWFGTYRRGLYRYDGQHFENFSVKQGLADDIVYGLTEDKSGNLWIGTYNGASRYPGDVFVSFSKAEGLPDNAVRNIIEDHKGNYWFTTNSGGMCRYDGNEFWIYNRDQGLNHVRVHRIYEDNKQNLWFCTGDGVSLYDGKSVINFSVAQGLPYEAVRCVLQDKNGDMWFGTEVGLSKFDGKRFFNFTTQQGLPHNNVRDIVEDSYGNLWMGFSVRGGIARYDGSTFLNLDTAQGLTNSDITSLTYDSKGNLWIGTGNLGVSVLRKAMIDSLKKTTSTANLELFENFTINEGLIANVVWDIVEDKQGNIFIGGNTGFTVVRGGLRADKPISADSLEYYDRRNGFPGKDVLTQAMYADSKGFIWAGTGNKLVKFNYASVRKNGDPPNLRIQALRVDNEKLSWYNLFARNNKSYTKQLPAIIAEEAITYKKNLTGAERDSITSKFSGISFDSITNDYPVPVNLRLPYRLNNLTFEFAAIEPAMPDLIKYQYKLEGYDRDWSPVSEKSNASYGNIDEGTYTFQVKAMSPYGVWSKPLLYKFIVLPPWYRTWWAYTACIIIFLWAIYALYRNRVHMLEKKQALQLQTVVATQEEERKRISRDLHDDVGTKLSALKLFLSSLKSNAEKKQYMQIDSLVENSEQLINETIRDVREMLLNLSPGILEEFGFVASIEGLVTKINQAGAINFQLTIFGLNERLDKNYELALYRIVQELINNVLKHSQAQNVSLQIGYRDDKIIIMIEDDGKGFETDQHKEGYGLKNLATRTRLLNGTLIIDSKLGRGTSVSIEVPYKF